MTFKAPLFPDSVTVKANILNDTIFTMSAWGLASYKDYIILRADIDNYMLHLYDKTSGKRVKSFAKIGRGPQEVLFINNFHVNENDGILTTFSQPERDILVFHLDSIIGNKEHYMDRVSLKGYNQMTFFEAYKCPQGFLLYGAKYVPYPEGHRLTLFSNDGKYISSYDEYPVSSSPRDSINKRDPWGQLLLCRTMSPDGTKFAEACQIGGILETFDINRNITHRTLTGYFKPHYYTEDNRKIFTKNTQFGFLYLQSSNRHLYALTYNGNHSFMPIREIQVFDWQGNPIKKYKTESHLLSICPDEKEGKMYALAKTISHEIILISFNL